MKILPGQLISEKEIAATLNASKTPVREALIRLEDVGLVSVVPKSGTYVTPIRIDAYIEGCFTRLRLETGAVRRAAERSRHDQRMAQLDMILEQQAKALDSKDYVQFASLDEALHEAFFTVAGIPGVWHFLQKTQADVNRVRHLKRIRGIRRGQQVVEQHKTIIDAIAAGNADAANKALVAHIGSLESELEQLAAYPELLAFIDNQNTSLQRKQSGRRSVWSSQAQPAN